MGVAEQLHVEIRYAADRVILTLTGELDMASAPMLQSAVEGADLDARELVVLDLKGLEFIDSTGLRVLLDFNERCGGDSGRLRVIAGAPAVERLLDIVGLRERLPLITP